jgi:hypothetical protein
MAFVYDKINPLSLSEVKELIGEVDVEKNMRYERKVQNPYSSDSLLHTGFNKGFELGYNQALEDNKEKKYTEKDIDKAYWAGMQFVGEDKGSLGEFIQSLQPQAENAEVRELTGLSPD